MPHEDTFAFLTRYISIAPETFSRLVNYHDLLIKWQAKINLISNDSIQDIWKRHFLDSLQLLPLIPRTSYPIIDFGTGAGFPGMALAIAGISPMHLVESDSKKIAFLKEVARITSSNAFIHHSRIEVYKIPHTAVIMARAVADLNDLLSYAEPNVSRETICLFPKGKNYATEIADAEKLWQFDCNVIKSVTDNDGVILQLSHIQRR